MTHSERSKALDEAQQACREALNAHKMNPTPENLALANKAIEKSRELFSAHISITKVTA